MYAGDNNQFDHWNYVRLPHETMNAYDAFRPLDGVTVIGDRSRLAFDGNLKHTLHVPTCSTVFSAIINSYSSDNRCKIMFEVSIA